ncbi:MAG TPA: amidohydrolase family protein [Jatrophihabitans sp.]|jgi:cytosine deaminase
MSPSDVIRNVTLDGYVGTVDVAVTGGVITSISAAADDSGQGSGGFEGAYAFPGFADVHLHLDKAHLLEHVVSGDDLAGAVARVRKAKRAFTVDDVKARAARVLDSAIAHGTTLIRSYVEVDPDAGLRSWDAISQLQREYSDRIDLRLVPFAQDGTTGVPATLALLERALSGGASAVGGCSYTDRDPAAHIRTIFDLGVAHDLPVDFHVDFDLDRSWEHLSLVLDETERRGWQGRVTVGHVTKLSALDAHGRTEVARRMGDLGVGLVVLPATDIFLPAREIDVLKPRSVAPPIALVPGGPAMAVATNNVCNPFTPYGDADVLRMANLYAMLCQFSDDRELAAVWSMVTGSAETFAGASRGIEVGSPATLVVLDAPDSLTALRELRQPLAGFFNGRRTFTWARPTLLGRAG